MYVYFATQRTLDKNDCIFFVHWQIIKFWLITCLKLVLYDIYYIYINQPIKIPNKVSKVVDPTNKKTLLEKNFGD